MKRGNIISIASFPSNEPAPQKKLVARGTSGINKITYIGDLTDGAGDMDGDGLADWEEVVQYGTDPLNPDSNGDGLPDGRTQGQYDAHRLFNGEDGDRTVVVTLQEPVPAGGHAVLRIGDMPILLAETNSQTPQISQPPTHNPERREAALNLDLRTYNWRYQLRGAVGEDRLEPAPFAPVH